ncbi:MAG: concentrative nucleoside transporter, family [Candidatus Dependentiae bacterium]|nr:concentrative nucleoside transporter, family [Candidatus Dependentiae bacterium]
MNIVDMLPTGRFVGLLGIGLVLLVAYAFSRHRQRIAFDVVVKGLGLQAVLAYFILCTAAGSSIFAGLANGFQKIYQFADQGAAFVFGGLSNPAGPWGFIFGVKVLAMIIFIGALMSLLFHLGVVQKVVKILALVVRPLLGTTGPETLCAAANSMMGQTEAPLLIKNYLKDMTESEILVVMVSGMATLSGAILAVYGGLGVPMHHLLASSIMAIPGSILIAKILLPETEKGMSDADLADMRPETKNVLDAISAGTVDGMSLAANVAAMLISFISIIALVNYVLGAVTGIFCESPLTLSIIFGKIFAVVAYAIGIPGAEIEAAGALLGTKLVVNEFVAYIDMVKSGLSGRSQVIMTYALCGFSNFSCIGIQIGGIGALVPSKRELLSRLGMLALLGGTLTNLLCAAIAGLFV